MLKILKIAIVLFMILLFINTVVSATDINMNLTSETNNQVDTNNTDLNATTDDTQTQISDGISGTAAPSGVSSIAQENMSFSNILNILVITVGVILILLAIAILIRLKN